MICPLCDGNSVKKLEGIKKSDLIKLYQKLTGVNFAYLINSDLSYCECEQCGLRFYYPLITGDEKFYNALQKFDWYYVADKKEFRIVSKFIGKMKEF